MSPAAEAFNVLVASGGSFQGLAVLQGLRRLPGVRILLADCYAEHVGRYWAHRSYVVPRVSDESGFAAAIEKICRDEQVRLVIPATDFELPSLARLHGKLAARGTAAAVSDEALVETLQNKRSAYRCLQAASIPVLPLVVHPETSREFPLIGKPVAGWGGRGLIVARCAAELPPREPGSAGAYVWQRYLADAREHSIDFAIGFHGEISPFSIRRRERTVAGFAVVASGADEASLTALAEQTARWLAASGGRGLFNVQTLQTDEQLVVSDVNPRVGVSSVFSLAEGLNFPGFLCQSLGSAVREHCGEIRRRPSGLKMVRQLHESYFEAVDLSQARGVVFDLDDTLLAHKQWIVDKLQLLHDALGERLPPRRAFLQRALGHLEEGNRSALFDALSRDFFFDDRFRGELIERYRELVPERAALYPDVLPTLRELRARGFRTALLTDNPVRSQQQKLQVAGLSDQLDAVVFSREHGPEKPGRSAFMAAAQALDLPPERLLMVGDNLYRDILAALDAKYLHAFLVRRAGGFFNCDVANFQRLFADVSQFSAVDDLAAVLHYLPGDVAIASA